MSAHVGLNEADARKQGIDVGTCVQEFRDVDRAIRDGTDDGFVKVHVKKGTAQIVSATIVADHADECSVTGVTSNPTIVHKARDSRAYDDAIGTLAGQGKSGEDLFASTRTTDPQASDVLYVEGLVAPLSINTMPEGTLEAFADHGETGPLLPFDGGECEAGLTMFATAGVTSIPWPRDSRTRGPRRSSHPGTNSSRSSRPRPRRSEAQVSEAHHGTDARNPRWQGRGPGGQERE